MAYEPSGVNTIFRANRETRGRETKSFIFPCPSCRASREISCSHRLVHKAPVKQAMFRNGNRTEWSPIRSVIIRVITKSDDRAAGVRFVYHEYDYRPNWTTRSPIVN